MMIIRPIRESDQEGLEKFALTAGLGVTSLPKHPTILKQKVRRSVASFANKEDQRDGLYLFILEDLTTGELGGTCAIEASTLGSEDGYVFRVEELVQPKARVPTAKTIRILQPIQRKNFATEIGGLYLLPKFRHSGLGRLLSLSRFLFIAAFPERFNSLVVAEMRGRIEKNTFSPFYNAVGQHFVKLTFNRLMAEATQDHSFIPNVMPRFPIYISLLPLDAQRAIGKIHKNTKAALNMLINEGFQPTGEVDIFVAGPKLAAQTSQIRTIVNSRKAVVSHLVEGPFEGSKALISNEALGFRACHAPVQVDGEDGSVSLHRDVAAALHLRKGDQLSYVLAPQKPST